MKIKFLGTAAAEAFPAMFCDCENCRKARTLGGKNIRTRSQALINDEMFIDYSCDTYHHVLANNINLLDIKYCLITHIHEDHFYPDDFNWFEKGYSCLPQDWHGLTVYGSTDIKPCLEPRVKKSQGFFHCESHPPFKPFKIGDYTVTALKANHGTENPYLYIIEKNNKSFLYANDTGLFLDETWEYLKSCDICFDAVSMDCTAGTTDITYSSHMGLPRNIKTRDMLIKYGLASDNTKFILNHFSHNGGNAVYEEFSRIAEKHGFMTAYDGFEIEI